MKICVDHPEDDIVDYDLILFWGDKKRVITGADLLGRLLRGIAIRESAENCKSGDTISNYLKQPNKGQKDKTVDINS